MGKIIHPKYFPICQNEVPPIPCNTASRTLSQLMYEYWVAKTWRVKLLMSDNGAAQPPNPEYNFYFGLLNATTEEYIPCNLSYGYKFGDITENEFVDNGFDHIISESGLCSKTFGYFSRFNEANDDAVYIGDLQGLAGTGTANVAFGDGHTLSIPIAILSQQPEANQSLFFELITSIEITIDEYWSYGGTYDTTTGALL